MIFISARIVMDPAHTETFIQAAQAIVEPTCQEKGCNLYSFARDITDKDTIWVSEEWETEADLDAHLKTDHIAMFMGQLAHMNLLSMDAKKYQIASVGPMVAPEA